MRTSILALLLLSSPPLFAQEKAIVEADLNAVRTAMQIFYLDTNHFTTIENLDDVWASSDSVQAINSNGGALVINPSEGIPYRRFILQDEFFGPYLSYSSSRQREGPDGDYDEGTPIDLTGSGRPIYFYSPLGLIEPKSVGLGNRYYGDEFDQYMIVSHGLDGQPRGGDDVLIPISGFSITVPVISSARLREADQKSSNAFVIVVKGYNLGTNTGSAALLLDGQPAGTIQSWTPTAVTGAFTARPLEGSIVSIRLSNGAMALQQLAIIDEVEEEPVAVDQWMWYW